MSGGNPEEVAFSDRAARVPDREVIAVRGNVHTWIEPWYGAYAILGALTSGLAVISVPLVVTNGGGSALQIGTAIAVQEDVGIEWCEFAPNAVKDLIRSTPAQS